MIKLLAAMAIAIFVLVMMSPWQGHLDYYNFFDPTPDRTGLTPDPNWLSQSPPINKFR